MGEFRHVSSGSWIPCSVISTFAVDSLQDVFNSVIVFLIAQLVSPTLITSIYFS